MHRNQSVNVHQFSMVPKADIPRSSFRMQTTHKTTFDGGLLVPFYVQDILPGDTFKLNTTAFARMATPLAPLMDNLHMDFFYFFAPYRLLWSNWEKFMGEQNNPGDSTSFLTPQQVCPAGGYAVNSLQDYLGLPTVGQVQAGLTVSHNALPLRAYNLIYNEWFRDENLQNSLTVDLTDGPDNVANYTIQRRGKRHDYFTSALPWPQKGNSVTLPLGTSAPIRAAIADGNALSISQGAPGTAQNQRAIMTGAGANPVGIVMSGALASGALYADLSQATAATINQLRQSFQVQKLLERDARGGTRYTEILRAHFGVLPQDARLQRPEYLGGGSSPVNINPIAQTSATGLTGATTPLGNLSAMGTAVARNGFTQSFTEHGVVLGLVSIRADLTYQQGIKRMWNKSTRYDEYFPAFAMLGEQTILNKEIYVRGDANDPLVFGYQERWAEHRYFPSLITGLFRSTSAGTIDLWHAAQRFTSLPALNNTFIQDTPPISRIIAVGAGANGQQFLFDAFIDINAARPLPMYSVPGLIDHF